MRLLALACMALAACQNSAPILAAPPVPAPVPFVEDLHGVPRHDDFRWMEHQDEEFSDWARRESTWARQQLDMIPGRDDLFRRIKQLDVPAGGYTDLQARGNQWIYERLDLQSGDRVTFSRTGADGQEKVFDVSEAIPSVDGTISEVGHARVLSPDGRFVTIGTTLDGETSPTLRVYDIGRGEWLPDTIDGPLWADSRGFRPRWLADSSGFFYVRNPDARPGMDGRERASRGVVFLHVLGRPTGEDQPIFGYGLTPGIEETDTLYVEGEPDDRWLTILNRKSVGREIWAVDLEADGSPSARQVFRSDELVAGFGTLDGRLYTLEASGAERYRLISVGLDGADAVPEVEVPEQQGVLGNLQVSRDAVYVVERRLDGSRLHVVTAESRRELALPPGTVEKVSAGPDGEGAWVEIVDWLAPQSGWLVEPGSDVARPMGAATAPVSGPSSISELHWAVARDGVKLPYTVLKRTDTPADGEAFVLISGYGCFGTVNSPFYWPALEAWLERGGIFIQAGVRGGGELGSAWHQAGSDRNKPASFEDTIDTAKQLIADGWTRPGRIGVTGGSCGGATMGMAALEAPHLFGAAALSAAALDMNRIAAVTAAGPRTIREFGDPATEEGARRIDALSPYRQLLPGAVRPSLLIMSGANDYTIPLWMGGKFVAAARRANSDAAVFWRIDWDGGHNAGRDYASEDADLMAFMLQALGHPDFQPTR